MKVGLVLGGGAARGLAHIGVLKVLTKYHIPVHLIAATSVGAMLGAFYAAGISPNRMEAGAKRLGWSRLLKATLLFRGAFSSEKIEGFVTKNIGNKSFEELSIPLSIIATDLMAGNTVVMTAGPVAPAVAASTSIPGMFEPRMLDGKQLVDGLVTCNVPVEVARKMGADFVIASDVIPRVKLASPIADVVRTVQRAVDLSVIQQASYVEADADVYIKSVNENISPFALNEASRLVEMGEAATEGKISEIQEKLGIIRSR